MKPVLEPIHQNKKHTITAFRYDKEDFETPWHFHPQHELTFIEQSFGIKFIGDYVGNYQPGQLVLLRSNVPHCWKNHSVPNGCSKSIVVQWDRGIYNKIPELESVFQLLRTASKGIVFDNVDALKILPDLKKLLFLEGASLYIGLLELLSKLSRLKYSTLSDASFFNDIPSEFGTRMAKIHDFVDTFYHMIIYLLDLVALVNLSEQFFARFFI